jgi:hypothetical protein
MSTILSFFNAHPVIRILAIVLLAIIVLVLIISIANKLRRKHIKTKETREMMRDLLTWKHLSQLVKGGSDHDKAKQELSDNLVRIHELIREGLGRFFEKKRDAYRQPWFMILGEPRSGKSSLLESAELELEKSAEESAESGSELNSLPIRFWKGSQAVICDVSGKVFFDRWLEGSSAEWNYIVKLLCRRHAKKPLDGIILTIPADALLADEHEMPGRKAVLMANELATLLRASGMKLPVYVLVTKLDMVDGFKETSRHLGGELRHQILGWAPPQGAYMEAEFNIFWESLITKLHDGAMRMMSSVDASGTNRADKAGKLYLFPETFDSMQLNLKAYLKALFGEGNFHGTRNLSLKGLYFTSAQDLNIAMNPAAASLAGKMTDELLLSTYERSQFASPSNISQNSEGDGIARPYESGTRAVMIVKPAPRARNLRSFFVRDVLHRRVFITHDDAVFTRERMLMRAIPHAAVCAVLIGIASIWLTAALWRSNTLNLALMQVTAYYEWLDGVLLRGGVFKAPLIHNDGNGFSLDNTPIEGDFFSTRTQFYYNVLSYRDMKIHAPFGFGLSSLAAFGEANMGFKTRAYIANQLHAVMVRSPAIKAAGEKLILEQDTLTLDEKTKTVIDTFVLLDRVQAVDFRALFNHGDFKLKPVLSYLLPDASNDTLNLLDSFLPRYDRGGSYIMDVNYIYSNDFAQANRAAIHSILSAWQRQAVYPDSLYGKMKQIVSNTERINAVWKEITELLRSVGSLSTYSQVEEACYRWIELTGTYKNLIRTGRSLFEDIKQRLSEVNIPMGFESSFGSSIQIPDAYGDGLIINYLFNDFVINYCVNEYTGLFRRDMRFVEDYLAHSTDNGTEIAANRGSLAALRSEFAQIVQTETASMQQRVKTLQNAELFNRKLVDNGQLPSYFTVTEKLLDIASAIKLPEHAYLQTASFDSVWQRERNISNAAISDYDSYAKPYLENEAVSNVTSQMRNMLMAQIYYIYYQVFSEDFSFLQSTESNIAATVASRSAGGNVFRFSAAAMRDVAGSVEYDTRYDPAYVKIINESVAAFTSLFGGSAASDASATTPPFLRQVDRAVYESAAFMQYLTSFMHYWRDFPDYVYFPSTGWDNFRARAAAYRPFQVNSILQSLYASSAGFIGYVDDSLLTAAVKEEKNKALSRLNDKQAILSAFQSTDAERMMAAWLALPLDPATAFEILQNASDTALKESYLAVYSTDVNLGIGWWNDLVHDGVNVLAKTFIQKTLAQFRQEQYSLEAFPLSADANPVQAIRINEVKSLAALLTSMGVTPASPDDSMAALRSALHPRLFTGYTAQKWAETVYTFAAAVSNPAKPLAFTLMQPPESVQMTLAQAALPQDYLLAINRFRYVEVSNARNSPSRYATFMSGATTLLEGSAEDAGLLINFYRTSGDVRPAATATFNNPWSVFNLYLRRDTVTDETGTVYIPVYLNDPVGRYVYYLQVRFNTAIPAASDWYETATWPQFTVTDTGVSAAP